MAGKAPTIWSVHLAKAKKESKERQFKRPAEPLSLEDMHSHRHASRGRGEVGIVEPRVGQAKKKRHVRKMDGWMDGKKEYNIRKSRFSAPLTRLLMMVVCSGL